MHWYLKLLIYPLLEALRPRVIVEVGVEVGAVTGPLLRWAQANDAVLHAIDPDPNLSVERLQAEYGERLQFHREKSLMVLGELGQVELALIDGDHNWYTVINELRTLEDSAREQEREPPVMLLHDVGWPYGRRDLYYDPHSIPEAHRQPYARGGLKPGRAELGPGLNDHLENAQLEGTPANGVLSAVEDFVVGSPTEWQMWLLPGLSGMAMLVSKHTLEGCAPLRELVNQINSAEFLRAHCEAIEQARWDAELKRANIQRRLAETQLKQVTRTAAPQKMVALQRRVRELTERVAELEEGLEGGWVALAEQVRVVEGMVADLEARAHVTSAGAPPVEQPDTAQEQEAWRTLLDLYMPLAESALPGAEECDPLSLPSPWDVRGVLCAAEVEQEPGKPSVDVVVCVHDALAQVRVCLWSLLVKSERRLRLIVVDDGSGEETARWLRAFADRHPAVTLMRMDGPEHGYTLAANRGLAVSGSDYVVLLNSDTVLTPGWLERIVAHGEANPQLGVLGPLSNAATHQSVPSVRAQAGGWAVNEPPAWLTVDGIGAAVAALARDADDVRLPFLNGFCYVIKRAAIEQVGMLDEELFAEGYCEENDYSQRVRAAGLELGVVDDAYVHHVKSASYGSEGRAELAQANYEKFLQKHGREQMQALVNAMESEDALGPVRAAVAQAVASPRVTAELLCSGGGERPLSIVFLLPGLAHGGSGGSHSLYQETRALRSLGIPARIMLPRWDGERAAAVYGDAEDVFETFADEQELAELTGDADVISATHHKSVALLSAIRERRSDFLPAYYVQDYEPFFTPGYMAEEAVASYTALPDMLLFAKSYWLCNVVAERHGLFVAKVEPSLDSELFAPATTSTQGPLRVAAMVRPRTARRQPLATIAVLEELLARNPNAVEVSTFGCYVDELRELHPGAKAIHERHLGLLSRQQVAGLLRESDVFLDMSVYQAFGRTALEAMACGATAVVPSVGGVWEFVVQGENAVGVDTLDTAGALRALEELAGDRELLERRKRNALATARAYSATRAALSEYVLFARAWRARFGADGATPALPRAALTAQA
jgi:GT2 family glycosyltransferase